jgi:glycosyltransferase involved in cell wall biosynthesis
MYIDDLIERSGLQDNIVMPGYIENEELKDHFAMSDMYVMPSRKEGFGIVFIEAMYYGLPVIAGDVDGSRDALLNGRLGQLVHPDDVARITIAINNILVNKSSFTPDRNMLMKNFSYEMYKRKLELQLFA